MVGSHDGGAVELQLEDQVHARGPHIAHFERVVLREDVLHAEVPVDRIPEQLIAGSHEDVAARAWAGVSVPLRRVGLDAAAGQEAGSPSTGSSTVEVACGGRALVPTLSKI